MTDKAAALSFIDSNRDRISQAADAIFSYAELSLKEFRSCDYYCDVLAKNGFTVKKGICNIPTAFSATYGEGRPVIGILAEYDALSGLSQVPGCTEHKEIISGGNGHGCGHNLLGAGAFGAALGVKHYLENTKAEGTVILFGCPGEEGGAAKAFMARDGVWKDIDAALSWHPGDNNEVCTGTSNSCIQTLYTFYGRASHAAEFPHQGRSALDAVELMNVGIQYLREHMESTARIHYAITDAGGKSPNVVQPKASVLYMVRSVEVSNAVALQKRVDDVARGAALMTGTTMEKKFIDGLANMVTNHVLEKLMHDNLTENCVTTYSNADFAFAEALADTYPGSDEITGIGCGNRKYKDAVATMKKPGQKLNDFVLPLYTGNAIMTGSTDVGDVSWLCPTAYCYCTTAPNNCPGHSWQNTSSCGSPIGLQGAMNAARTIAATAIDLYQNPAILQEAKAEFQRRTKSGYTCPIPPDAVPTTID